LERIDSSLSRPIEAGIFPSASGLAASFGGLVFFKEAFLNLESGEAGR